MFICNGWKNDHVQKPCVQEDSTAHWQNERLACAWDDPERTGPDQTGQIWILNLKAMGSYRRISKGGE